VARGFGGNLLLGCYYIRFVKSLLLFFLTKKVTKKVKAVFNWRTVQHSAKRYKLARQTLCLSVLFLGSVWRASNSISFLTLHFCPNKFLNANSYNAGSNETNCKTGYKNAKYSIIETNYVTSGTK
jgi:hypothetical protein